MSLLARVIDTAYVKRAEHLLRREHDDWVRQAITRLGTKYWTIDPAFAAADNVIVDAYDIHGGPYVFTGYSKWFPSQLESAQGIRSWEIWHRYGPMTTTPQQTVASWNAANAAGHAAELRRMDAEFKANCDKALTELADRYPHSVRALTNA